jgi:hypothetical protein
MTSPPVAVVLSPSAFFANPSLSSNLVISAGLKMRICGCPFESSDSVANSTVKEGRVSMNLKIWLASTYSFRCLEM